MIITSHTLCVAQVIACQKCEASGRLICASDNPAHLPLILVHFGLANAKLWFRNIPKSQGYLNRSFPGVRKRGVKEEVKGGKGVREETGPERGGKNEGKRVRGKAPESAFEKL